MGLYALGRDAVVLSLASWSVGAREASLLTATRPSRQEFVRVLARYAPPSAAHLLPRSGLEEDRQTLCARPSRTTLTCPSSHLDRRCTIPVMRCGHLTVAEVGRGA